MGKTQISVVIALLGVLALSGCAAGGTVQSAPDLDRAYLVAVHNAAPTLDNTKDAVLIKSGRGVCSALNSGASAERLSSNAVLGGLALVEGDAIIQSAIDAYCPTNVWRVDI